jgi:hypothetical protein
LPEERPDNLETLVSALFPVQQPFLRVLVLKGGFALRLLEVLNAPLRHLELMLQLLDQRCGVLQCNLMVDFSRLVPDLDVLLKPPHCLPDVVAVMRLLPHVVV